MQRSSLACCGALMLVALAACGVPEGRAPQPAVSVQPTSLPDPSGQPASSPEAAAGQPTSSPEVTAGQPASSPEATAEQPASSPEPTAGQATSSPEPTAGQATSSPEATAGQAASSPEATAGQAASSPEPTAGQATSSPEPTAAGDAQAAGWQTYRNEQAGYTIAYAPGWTVTEQQGPDGRAQVSFRGPDMRVRVVVRPGPVDPAPTDLPNARCVTVTVAGRAATRCNDVAARSAVTTVPDGDRAIQITADGKGYDAALYQQYLDSFTLLPDEVR